MNQRLIVPGQPAAAVDSVPYESREPVMYDGVLMELVITGEAEVVRGPLGRFLDLRDQIRSEGLTVPSELSDLLDRLNEQKGC